MSQQWTIQKILNYCVEYLRAHEDEHPRRSAEWILSAVTSLSRVELYAYFDRPVSVQEREDIREALKRRGRGEPLQYITGESAFRHIVVRTEKGVLIPRPETEVLVQVVIDALEQNARKKSHTLGEGNSDSPCALGEERLDSPHALGEELLDSPHALGEERLDSPRILEVGTGTGCIALSLAKECDARLVATDINPAAIACATRNAEALGLEEQLQFVECDCIEGIESEAPFDVLISNPPYIPTAVLGEIPAEVSNFEPHLALNGGEDGLDFFRRLLVEALPLLRRGGIFACELHETCLEQAAELAREAGLKNICIYNDLANKPRILYAEKA